MGKAILHSNFTYAEASWIRALADWIGVSNGKQAPDRRAAHRG
jgi:hypothetical protein